MSENQQTTATNEEPQVNDQQVNDPAPAAPTNHVEREAYEKVKADLHRYKTEAREKEAKLKSLEEEKLKEKEDWKTLAERKQAEADEWKTKYETTSSAVVTSTKLSAVKQAALAAGMHPGAVEDLSSMDLDGVTIETTSLGNHKVHGADSFIEELKRKKSYLFGGKKTTVAGGIPDVNAGGTQVTHSDLIKASLEAQKSGDYKKYNQMMQNYHAQKTQPRG